eukprot:COSAG01_NODE_68427_length_264_cov_0.624242_1_plen_45_part_10
MAAWRCAEIVALGVQAAHSYPKVVLLEQARKDAAAGDHPAETRCL